ncbi:MAG: phosphatidylserine decarboxylase, partial [Chlamydiia bacterium]|nr:phosphatidylserine decarboxylase [Chlamydiia bacterium]
MMKILDRKSKTFIEEKIYGQKAVEWIHGASPWQRLVCTLACRAPVFSWVYGAWQKLPHTKAKIASFIRDYEVDAGEFASSPDQFGSFNEFFIRRLKKEARPIAGGSACMPADGRYTFFENVDEASSFWIKGSKWDLKRLLGSRELAERFCGGSAVLARLAPPDYHRFHF